MSKTKRVRINEDSSKNKEVEVAVETKVSPSTNDFKADSEFFSEDGEFDWGAYEATCPSQIRKHNKHIKTKKGDRVYSRESYAQELYDLMEHHYDTAEIPAVFTVTIGETLEGKVNAIDTEWATIDVGYRELVYVDMTRESEVSKAKLVPGEQIQVQITGDKKSNRRGFILGSVEAGVRAAITRELLESIDDGNTAYVGKVVSMIQNGGYIVSLQGVECFMPGSLAGINKLVDFESIIGEEMYVVPVSYSPEKGSIVVSHRKYLQALIPGKIEEISSNMDQVRKGNVTGSAKYGVFVEFEGCLTGMIHVNDLDPETLKLHKSREIKPGDAIEFKIKEVVSNSKITLTQVEQKEVVDPWKVISEKYTSFPVQANGIVKSIKDYGVFLEVSEGVVGLLHVSEFPEGFDTSTIDKGDSITVQITRIDADSRKLFLKI